MVWDGRTAERKKLSSGVYFLELNVGTTQITKRIVVLK
jgi:hypothetical protein